MKGQAQATTRKEQKIPSQLVWSGRWYEDMEVGDVVSHAFRRTVIEADNVWFSCITMNMQPLHVDAEFASATEFGRPLVNSMFTIALVVGISVPELTLGTTVANLGFEQITFPAPVFHGDTIHAETEIMETRVSQSRPEAGIVLFEHRGFNQTDQLVVKAARRAMIRRRIA
jgi:acyl dehydratase